MIITIIGLLAIVGIVAVVYLQQPQFGKAPNGARLERIKNSPNYKNGKFKNLQKVSMLPEGYSMAGEVWRTFFRQKPAQISNG